MRGIRWAGEFISWETWLPATLVLCVLSGWSLGGLLVVEAEDKKPAVSETQSLRVINAVQRLELAQLRSQAAQAEYQKALAELQALELALQVPGYDFNLQAMIQGREPYTRRAENAPEGAKK